MNIIKLEDDLSAIYFHIARSINIEKQLLRSDQLYDKKYDYILFKLLYRLIHEAVYTNRNIFNRDFKDAIINQAIDIIGIFEQNNQTTKN